MLLLLLILYFLQKLMLCCRLTCEIGQGVLYLQPESLCSICNLRDWTVHVLLVNYTHSWTPDGGIRHATRGHRRHCDGNREMALWQGTGLMMLLPLLMMPRREEVSEVMGGSGRRLMVAVGRGRRVEWGWGGSARAMLTTGREDSQLMSWVGGVLADWQWCKGGEVEGSWWWG